MKVMGQMAMLCIMSHLELGTKRTAARDATAPCNLQLVFHSFQQMFSCSTSNMDFVFHTIQFVKS